MHQVGSVIRVTHPGSPNDHKRTKKNVGQATIATLDDDKDDSRMCVLMHDSAPQPLANQKFLVTPMFESPLVQEETMVPYPDVMELLDFEQEEPSLTREYKECLEETILLYKERGDALFKLGDATMAASWYEFALATSSNLSVGATVACWIRKQGRKEKTDAIRICDVDCIDDASFDVVDCETEQEMTVSKSEILLSLLPGKHSSFVQERILLNLSRCTLQLAQFHDSSIQNRPFEYRKSAIVACSLVLALLQCKSQDHVASSNSITTTKSLRESALFLRSKAFTEQCKWKQAFRDVEHLLKLHPRHKEGLKLRGSIEEARLQKFKSNKKLARAVCEWVDVANNQEEALVKANPSPETVSNHGANSKHKKPNKATARPPDDAFLPIGNVDDHLLLRLALFISSLLLLWMLLHYGHSHEAEL